MVRKLVATTISEAFDYSLIPTLGIVSLAFDDGFLSTFTKAYPILDRYNLSATAFIVTDRIGLKDYMSFKELRNLATSGWEIGSHSVTHPKLTELSFPCIFGELYLSKKILTMAGFNVKSFAVPGGDANREIWNCIKELYQFSRDISDALNPRPFEHHELKSFSLLTSTRIEEVKDRIDECIGKKAWLILTFHEIGGRGDYNNSEAFLEEICECIRARGAGG